MPRNIFISGLPKSGKTTLLQKLVEELKKSGKKVGGFLSPASLEHGSREGFIVEDIETGKKAQLASLSSGGPKVGKYCVKVKEFESIAIPAMNKVDKYDVFVMDEIGRMEMKSKKFVNLLDKVFESKTLVIASISEEYAPTYGFQGEIFLLTQTNREAVYLELLRKAMETPAEIVKQSDVVGAAQEVQTKHMEARAISEAPSLSSSQKPTPAAKAPSEEKKEKPAKKGKKEKEKKETKGSAGKKAKGKKKSEKEKSEKEPKEEKAQVENKEEKKGPEEKKGLLGKIRNLIGI